MTEYKIEKGVPIPVRRGSIGRPLRYPWPDMEHGDSVVIPRNSRNAAGDWIERNRPGWRAITRKETEDTVRVWFLNGAVE